MMEQTYILISYITSFAAIFLLAFSVIGAISLKHIVKVGKGVIVDARQIELKDALGKRVFKGIWVKLSRFGRIIAPQKRLQRIKKNLILAGSPRQLDVDKFLALKVLLAITFMITFVLPTYFVFNRLSIMIFSLAMLGAGGYYLPDLYIHRLIQGRKKAIRRALPDTLDLLTISVEAGLGFDAAMQRVVKKNKGPLAEEFRRMLKEIQLGSSRREAFQNLSKRTEVPELESFILAMLQADVFGIRIGKVLRVQSSEMRIKRRQEAEEIAMKAPVKIVFPLVFCIFPALLAVILGPAVIGIYEAIIKSL